MGIKTSLENGGGRKELILRMNVPYTEVNPIRKGRALIPLSLPAGRIAGAF